MIFSTARKNSRSSDRLLYDVGFTLQRTKVLQVLINSSGRVCKAFVPYTLNYSHIIIFPDLNSDKKNKHWNVASDAYSGVLTIMTCKK